MWIYFLNGATCWNSELVMSGSDIELKIEIKTYVIGIEKLNT